MIFEVQIVRESKNYNFDVKKETYFVSLYGGNNKFASFYCFSVTIVGKEIVFMHVAGTFVYQMHA